MPQWMAFQMEHYKQPGCTAAIAQGGSWWPNSATDAHWESAQALLSAGLVPQ